MPTNGPTTIYVDNGATTFPKPNCVPDAILTYMTSQGCSINRGSYEGAFQVEEIVYETRQLLSDLFNYHAPEQVIFTKNITESLNIILKSYLQAGDHVLLSSMEHNAVLRPMMQLQEIGVTFSFIPCNTAGEIDLTSLPALCQSHTKAVIINHASNVCGTIQPLLEIGKFCQHRGLTFIVDAAQTAGVLPIDMKAMHIDALAFTGHKGLLGPQGIGGFIITEELSRVMAPFLAGGTGSQSDSLEMPSFMPDKFEPGTPNLPGIIGLHAALLWLKEKGIGTIYNHEKELTDLFLDGLQSLVDDHRLTIIGLPTSQNRTGVVSISCVSKDNALVANTLATEYHIATRVGLHCAPTAHQTLQTFPAGTIRFSFGWWNTPEQVAQIVSALTDILTK